MSFNCPQVGSDFKSVKSDSVLTAGPVGFQICSIYLMNYLGFESLGQIGFQIPYNPIIWILFGYRQEIRLVRKLRLDTN